MEACWGCGYLLRIWLDKKRTAQFADSKGMKYDSADLKYVDLLDAAMQMYSMTG